MSRRSDETAWDEAVGVKRSPYGANTLGWVLGEYRASPGYRNLSPNTKRIYERAFNRLHKFRKQPFAGMKRRHIVKIRNDLAATPAAANNFVCAVQALCRFALDANIVETNPAIGIGSLELGSWRRWTDAELETFYNGTYEAMRRVFVMALYTGQRCSDLCKALWSDIDQGGIRVVQAKTKRKLWVPLHPVLEAHLKEWRKGTASVAILTGTNGKPFRPEVLTAAFSRAVKDLDLGGCKLHGLRKTAAAKLAEAGCSARQIMAVTGHRTLAEVERYTEEADQRKLAAAAIRRLNGKPLKMVCKPLKDKVS